MLHHLMNIIWRALKKLAEFLAILLFGLIATVLIILPWLFRSLALLGWIAGTFLMWNTVNNLYGVLTPPLPLLALLAVPAILSSALVVWLFAHKQPEKLWGAMALWGLIGWLVWKGSALLQHWQYGWWIVQILPAALSAVLLLYINLRWGSIIRSKRLIRSTLTPHVNSQEGGDIR